MKFQTVWKLKILESVSYRLRRKIHKFVKSSEKVFKEEIRFQAIKSKGLSWNSK